MDKIIREFRVKRGERELVYPFTTYSCIFTESKDERSNKVFSYLRKVFLEGVPDLPCESISESHPFIIKAEQIKHEVVDLAKRSDYRDRRSFQHSHLQRFFMENDPATLAIEIPVWNGSLSGHIDLLRLTDKIQVLDFKPEAHKETKASSQVYKYIMCLSKALQLPLSDFEGIYFDDRHAFRLAI